MCQRAAGCGIHGCPWSQVQMRILRMFARLQDSTSPVITDLSIALARNIWTWKLLKPGQNKKGQKNF